MSQLVARLLLGLTRFKMTQAWLSSGGQLLPGAGQSVSDPWLGSGVRPWERQALSRLRAHSAGQVASEQSSSGQTAQLHLNSLPNAFDQ